MLFEDILDVGDVFWWLREATNFPVLEVMENALLD
jgi:hypothetical protein